MYDIGISIVDQAALREQVLEQLFPTQGREMLRLQQLHPAQI